MENDEFQFLKAKLKKTKSLKLVIASDSMEPILKTHKEYLVSYQTYDQLNIFDIVVFYEGQRLLAHFLWNRSEHSDQWITKSYRYPAELDSPLNQENFLGVIRHPRMSAYHKTFFTFKAWLSNNL